MNHRVLLLILLMTAPFVVLGAEPPSFVPIAPLPNPSGGGIATQGDLSTYLNSLFQLALIVGAVLAVIFIAIGGFEYIFSEAMENKHDGRLRITHAVYGLGILLLVAIILYVIGGQQALCLDIFSSGC